MAAGGVSFRATRIRPVAARNFADAEMIHRQMAVVLLWLALAPSVGAAQSWPSWSAIQPLHADIRGWRQTSTITEIVFRATELCVHHTQAGRWPVRVLDGTAGEGNPWVFAAAGGQWYGATSGWLRPGQVCKGVTRTGAASIGGSTKAPPLETWTPAVGELVCFAVSTFARDATRSSNERSDLVCTPWGTNWSRAERPPPHPGSDAWRDRGPILDVGPRGHGAISPTYLRRVGDELQLFHIAARGDRPDGGPAERWLHLSVSPDGGATWLHAGRVLTWSPRGNEEEGIFSASPTYFSAVTAATATTDDVWSDIRRRDNGALVLDHADRAVWGWGDELFVLDELPDRSVLYIAKGYETQWGLGRAYPDGRTDALVASGPEVVGGGAVGWTVVLARGLDVGGAVLEWYDARQGFAAPLRTDQLGARHVAPYFDGRTWWLYGRLPESDVIRRWELTDPAALPPPEGVDDDPLDPGPAPTSRPTSPGA